MKKFLVLVLILVAVSGCTFDKYNRMVEHQNETLFKAFADGISKQNSEAGRLAVTMAFVTGVGRQSLRAPETAATYIPMVNAAIVPWIALFHHGGDDNDVSQSYAAGRDLIFQSTIDDNSHNGTDMLSQITGNYNNNTQYVCPTCEDGTGGEAGIEGGLDTCKTNPPAGYKGSTPLWSKDCSCSSHYSGSC